MGCDGNPGQTDRKRKRLLCSGVSTRGRISLSDHKKEGIQREHIPPLSADLNGPFPYIHNRHFHEGCHRLPFGKKHHHCL